MNEESDPCVLDFESIYNFDIGDIFQYKRITTGTPGLGEVDNITIDKYQIMNVARDGDSLKYSINGLRLYYESNQQGFTYFHRSSNINSTLVYVDSTRHILNLCNDTALVKGHQDYYAVVTEQLDDTIIQKHIGGYGNLFVKNEENILILMDYEDYEEIYRIECGLIRHVDSHFEHRTEIILQGYIKGADTTGIITPDEDLIVSKYEATSNPNISIYPNPASDVLNLNLPDKLKEHEIEIFHFDGRKIKSCLLKGNTVSIKDLKSGLYFIRILEDRNAVYVSKFIKE